MEAFLQASNCPKHTKNAWLYLKNSLQKLSITQSTHPTSAQEEILKELSSIKKSISTLSRQLLQAPSYADQARKSAPQAAHEKPVSGRALKEVTVKVIDVPKPSQTSERLIESINAARSSKAGKVLAARKLKSGDICVTADSHETKIFLEHEDGWTHVIGGRTNVRGRRFTVMAHGVETN
jgi:2-oxoglutarate dehydrogenase complex dehydrogenase (E1) component-like enzyme